jgi:hypothetical protein
MEEKERNLYDEALKAQEERKQKAFQKDLRFFRTVFFLYLLWAFICLGYVLGDMITNGAVNRFLFG